MAHFTPMPPDLTCPRAIQPSAPLIPTKSDASFSPVRPWVHPGMTTAEYPEEYKVNKLIGHRKVGRVAEFLVRWCAIKGEKFDDSWEAAIREYKARLSGIECAGRRQAPLPVGASHRCAIDGPGAP